MVRPPSTGRQTPVTKSFFHQRYDRLRHVLWSAYALQQRSGHGPLHLGQREVAGWHHRSGQHAIDAHRRVPPRQFNGQRAGERGNRSLAEKIGGVIAVGTHGGPFADGDDDAARRLPDHRQPAPLTAEERAQRVDLEVPPHVGSGRAFQRGRFPNRGRGDQHVEPAEAAGDLREEPLDLCLVGHVGGKGLGLHPLLPQFHHALAGLLRRAMVVQRDAVAAGRQRPGHHVAHATLAAAGDQGHLANIVVCHAGPRFLNPHVPKSPKSLAPGVRPEPLIPSTRRCTRPTPPSSRAWASRPARGSASYPKHCRPVAGPPPRTRPW